MSELILYTSDDGLTRLDRRVEGENVWLTQLEIAELFQTTKQNVSMHAKNIFEDGELSPEATVKDSLTVRNEGNRQVQRRIQLYNLDLILAIGYRVRSSRGTQFRQWATTHLREYPVKGVAMDDERLKAGGTMLIEQYFEELLWCACEGRDNYERRLSTLDSSFNPQSTRPRRARLCASTKSAFHALFQSTRPRRARPPNHKALNENRI